MCTHNQCFRAKIRKKYYNFSSENYYFYSRGILLYIARACFRNAKRTKMDWSPQRYKRRFIGSGEEEFEGFLPYMGMAAILFL